MKSFIYYNLHKCCFSIKHNGIVVAHADTIEVRDATPKVSEAGRQRVIKEKRKNVHAGIVGTVTGYQGVATDRGREMGWTDRGYMYSPSTIKTARALSYNPYKGPDFIYRDDGSKFVKAKKAILHNRAVYAVKGE